MNRFLFLIIITLLALRSSPQTLRTFSEEPDVFIKEIPRLFESVTVPGVSVEIMLLTDTLTGEWNRNAFTDEEKREIIQVANLLLDKRIKPYPEFFNFFKVIMELHTRDEGHTYVSGYLAGLRKRVEERSIRRLRGYLDTFTAFLLEKKLFGNNSFSWSYTDSAFLMEYDSVPRFLFKRTDLICNNSYDTAVIYETGGVYYPLSSQWDGFGGGMDWRRLGFSKDTIFARLTDYRIFLEEPGYTADSAIFFDKRFFRDGLMGTIEERVLSGRVDKFTSFPRFFSYEKDLEMRGLFRSVDYYGGYTLKGTRVIGTGNREHNAVVTIPIDDEKQIILRSHTFSINKDGFRSNPSTLSISIGGDSLYHPGLQVIYDDNTKELTAVRDKDGISGSPFFNTFHDINMYVEALHWDMSATTIEFRSILGITRVSMADFVSNDFFTEYDFDKLQGLDAKNPLFIIRNFARDYKTHEISPQILAGYMNKPPEQVEATMIRLAQQGFLYFDAAKQVAVVEDKLLDYIDAKMKNADYDVISIHSEVKNDDNAVLDLQTLDLMIRGVEEVFLSDSQNVHIYPRAGEIVLKEGRDFVFTGRVKAGMFDFFANECSFEYDAFRLNLPTVDSLSFQVKSFEKNKDGEYPLRRVRTVIEGLSGTLLIDEPGNKSGLKAFKDYPKFISEQESFVYYDKDSIYTRDVFRYHVAPFQLDSLDAFSTEGLQFKGYLDSKDILPIIDQPLKVRPDYSLGFVKETPREGFPVYGGRGIFYSIVDLSNKGLMVDGTLKYLNSTTETDSMFFYPDSAIAYSLQEFRIREKTGPPSYPEVSVDSARSGWYPYRDTMMIYMEKHPFRMFGGEAEFLGYLTMTNRSLTGSGNMVYDNARMSAHLFRFGRKTVDSDSLDLRYFTADTDSLALIAQNYKAHLDLETRKIDFTANIAGSEIRFPYNDFICTMESIDWFLDSGELVLFSERLPASDSLTEEEIIETKTGRSEFISTNPKQDSLFFTAGFARYSLNNYEIRAEEVDIIRVADAAIFPPDGLVTIRKGGKLDPLHQANLIASTKSKSHTIRQAEVQIFSRQYYEGSGLYQYEPVNGVIQEIRMTEIRVDSTHTTIGRGYIGPEDNFLLSPHFAFRGEVSLNAGDKRLLFEGGFMIIQDCYEPQKEHWAYFRAHVDPKDVRIPVDPALTDLEGTEIHPAIYYSSLKDDIYPTMFGSRGLLSDTAIFSNAGWLTFDTAAGSFLIEPFDPDDRGGKPDRLRFDTRKCAVRGTGELHLPMDLGYIDLLAQGWIEHLIIPDSTFLNVALVIDFYFDEESLRMLADSIRQSDLRGFDATQKSYNDLLLRLSGQEGIAALQGDLGIFSSLRNLPEELDHTFILTDLDMYWNTRTRSFVSSGPFGLAVAGSTPVHRMVDGYLELVRKRSGDEFNLYIEAGPRKWYLFTYKNGIMQTTSTDLEYNAKITDLKARKRMTRRDGMDDMEYEFTIADRRKRIEFLRKMEEFNP